MRVIKCLLLIMVLLFVSSCSDIESNQSNESASQTQLSEPTRSLSSESFDYSNFPPSDWPEKSIVTHEEDDGKIFYQEGIYSDRFWTPVGLEFLNEMNDGNAGAPTKEKPAIPSKETAVAIASAIFYTHDFYKRDNYITSGAFFDTQDEVWVVVFFEPNLDYASETITIMLRKDNAQLLAIWSEAG